MCGDSYSTDCNIFVTKNKTLRNIEKNKCFLEYEVIKLSKIQENKISVIIPVYNVEKYLEACVQSVLTQEYKETEVILVDDGSTDNSGAICDRLQKENPEIIVIHKQNAGLGLARNTGLEAATGEFVTFLDSDDILYPTELLDLYNAMIKNNVDYCKGGFKRIKDDGTLIGLFKYEDEIFAGEDARLSLLPRLIGSSPKKHDSIGMSVWGSLYKNHIIQENNLRFPSERELMSEDIVFNIDYFQYANGGCVISSTEYGYRYRQDASSSLTIAYRSDRFASTMKLFEYLHNKMTQLGYGEDTLLRVDRNLFVNLVGCISQEGMNVVPKEEALKHIKDICQNRELNEVIGKYPINELGFKQRAFLFLIRKKQSKMLYLLSKKI